MAAILAAAAAAAVSESVARLVAAFKDASRKALSVAPAPRGSLIAVADSLGRVLLVNSRSFAVLRMWKVRGHQRPGACILKATLQLSHVS